MPPPRKRGMLFTSFQEIQERGGTTHTPSEVVPWLFDSNRRKVSATEVQETIDEGTCSPPSSQG